MRSFAASSAHKGMWLAQKMTPTRLNHALIMWEIPGVFNIAVMASACRHVLGEAEVLRVNFTQEGGEVRMSPRELGEWQPFYLDLTNETDPENAAYEALAELINHPFDLEKDLLFRIGVVSIAVDRSLLVIAYHHLVSDGFGIGGLFSARLAEVYSLILRGDNVHPLPHSWMVEPYSRSAATYLGSTQFNDDAAFWRAYLRGASAPSQVPRIDLSEASKDALAKRISEEDRWAGLADAIGMVSRTMTVPHNEIKAWAEVSESLGIWVSSFVATAAAIYFRHRCETSDVVFSLAVANRSGAARHSPGLAVNVVPLRVELSLNATVPDAAEAVVEETSNILGHSAHHYSDIQRASGASLNGRGGFGTAVNVVEFLVQPIFGGLSARYIGATTGSFDELSIGVYSDGTPDGDWFLRLDAPGDLYSSPELAAIGSELLECIRSIVDDPNQRIGEIFATRGDSRAVETKSPNQNVPALSISELFADQVRRHPDSPAVVRGREQLTYRLLDELSGRVAGALLRQGLDAETVIGVQADPSFDLVISLMGIVKAGAAYALLYDKADSAFDLPDGSAFLVGRGNNGVSASDTNVLVLQLGQILTDPDCGAVGSTTHAENIIAVVHEPAGKLVGVTHRNLQHTIAQVGKSGELVSCSLMCGTANPGDPILAHALWAPLVTGGRVAIPDDSQSGVLESVKTRAFASPATLAAMLQKPTTVPLATGEIRTGGRDRIPPEIMRRIHEALPDTAIVFDYGSAEASGVPVHEDAAILLGPSLSPVSPGITAELYVAGSALARGYLKHPARTAERFVANPFGPPGARMYRTGDRARWSSDKGMELRGSLPRLQVRGLWVDPAEIEDVLAKHPSVALPVVLEHADKSDTAHLVAYVLVCDAVVTAEDLRRFSSEHLPEAMVPSAFVILQKFPETAQGTIERSVLLAPLDLNEHEYRAPRNDTERVLVGIFADSLDCEQVGIDDDFFDMGGNSMRAIRLVGLIRAQLGRDVSIRTLFAARTVAALSETWQDQSHSSRPTLRRRTKNGQVV